MERLKAILAHPDFELYMARNEELEQDREFCGHRMEHAIDVARIFYILYLEQGRTGDFTGLEDMEPEQERELIYTTALLHDIGRWKQYMEKNLDHAVEGAALARPILQDTGFSPKESKIIINAIRDHRNPGATGLGKILFRSDKLSRNCAKCAARDRCYKFKFMETADGIVY